jgi:predicted transcriptional regulator
MTGMYALILTVAGLIGYGLYEMYRYMNKKAATKALGGPGEDSRQLNQLMATIYNHAQMGSNKNIAQNKVLKVTLMEDLDLRPKVMKGYIKTLQDKNLIKETLDCVTITPFGVQFYQVFQNDQLNIS